MKRGQDRLILIAVIVAIWYGLYLYAGDIAITPPGQTLAYLVTLFGTASFWGHVWASLVAFAAALGISIAGGVAIGLW